MVHSSRSDFRFTLVHITLVSTLYPTNSTDVLSVCFNPNPLQLYSYCARTVSSTDYSAHSHSSASLTGSQLPLASFTGSRLPPLASQTTLVTSLAGV